MSASVSVLSKARVMRFSFFGLVKKLIKNGKTLYSKVLQVLCGPAKMTLPKNELAIKV
jgi:hypothetical protein